MTAKAAIRVHGLTKCYGVGSGALVALSDIGFSVGEGEFTVFVGPSGCGKSTLLKILVGLDRATAGAAEIQGEAITGPRRDTGVVFQSPVLFPWRTVLDNVLLPIDVLRLDRKQHLATARELLSMAGLSSFERHYPWQLSGGMQQRVGIVRALVHDPKLLLMDEPFGALDALTRENMNMELQRIWMERRKTVIFITHSITEAVLLADRVLVMTPRPGRIVRDIRIDIPRPRDLSVANTPLFGEYVREVRELLNATGAID